MTIEDRADRCIHWLLLMPVTPMRDEVVGFIKELLATTFKLERERDEALDTVWPQ